MLDNRSVYRRLIASAPWLILALIVSMAALLGLILVRVDQWLDLSPDADRVWLYGGSGDAAIGVLSAIASSSVTVAGVVFSATYVTMQLASSQYTPRVVQALARRWSLHLVLGFFLASFAFSLLVLRAVRPTGDATEFVPVLSVSMSIVLAMASVGVFIFYVIYGMRSLQPTFIIDSAARETSELLHRSLAASGADTRGGSIPIDSPDPVDVTPLCVVSSGYFQMVRFRRLLAAAEEAQVTVRITAEVGQYSFQGERVASVWPRTKCSPEVEARVLDALQFGSERTAEQDFEYGFRRVADIMLKALSPAINDPTTAQYCLNTLGDLVILVANEHQPQRYLTDRNGVVRVIWEPEPFEQCVHTAFDQLRFYVVNDLTLAVFTLRVFQRVTLLIPAGKRAVLLHIAGNFLATVQDTFTLEQDRHIIARAAAWMDD